MADDLGKLIRQARLAKGWSQVDLAAKIGTTQSTIERIENNGSMRSRYRHEAAAALGLPSVETGPMDGVFVPPPDFLGKRDLPVYASVEGGPGEFVVSTDAIDVVPRPWFLERSLKAFAVVVTGESMEPVYEAGDMVLVNPKAPLVKGKDAIFTSEPLGGDFKASIKRYMGSTSAYWLAKQFNPPEGQTHELRFARDEWAEALRVVGKYIP